MSTQVVASSLLIFAIFSQHLRGASEASASPPVLVSSDAKPLPERFRPTPEKPVYYVLITDQVPFGEIIGGKLPDRKLVERTVVAELNKQGFIRTAVGGPTPSPCLVVGYGDANFAPQTEEEMEWMQRFVPPGSTVYLESQRYKDPFYIEAIVGHLKLDQTDSPRLLDAPHSDRFYVTILAFDGERFGKNKEKYLLWRTDMSINWPSDVSAVLPAMIAIGGPSFGRDLVKPVLVDPRDRRKAEVEIGETKVVPDQSRANPQPPGKSKRPGRGHGVIVDRASIRRKFQSRFKGVLPKSVSVIERLRRRMV